MSIVVEIAQILHDSMNRKDHLALVRVIEHCDNKVGV